MPGYRFNRRRYKFAKRMFGKAKARRYGISKVAKSQIASIAKRVLNNNSETKYTYYEFATAISDNWTGPASFIDYPEQGVTAYASQDDLAGSESKRIGNTIEIQHLQWNFRLDVADSSNVIRLVIFQWLQQSYSNDPTVGDIMMSNGAGYPYLDSYNYVNRKNYKILYDKTFTMSTDAGNAATIIRHVSFYGKRIPIRKLKFAADSASSFGADIVKGKIWYMFVSDSTVSPSPNINMSMRLLFKDA